MANQKKGRALLIKRETTPGSDTFTTVCGIKARSFSINNNPVDVTAPDCVTPEGIVYGQVAAGIQVMQFQGSGFFDSDVISKAIADDVMDQVMNINYQVIVPGLGTFEGPFCVDGLSYSGSDQGNLEFEATWRSNGTITFTAE